MGDNIWAVSTEGNERLLKTRLSFDLSENVHLHYRDFRWVFSKKEWEMFSKFVVKTSSLEELRGYTEGNEGCFFEFQESLPPESSYFDGRIRLERQSNGQYHLHLHDFRFEFSEEVNTRLIQLFNGSKGYSVLTLGELLAIVFTPASNEWLKIPIQESPVYLGLIEGTFVSHDEYASLLFNRFPDDPKIVSTEKYKALLKSIQEYGFDFSNNPKVLIKNKVIEDGHHRVSILLKLHGSNKKILIRNDELVGWGPS